MTFRLKTFVGLFCLLFAAACGPSATAAVPADTQAPTQAEASHTPRPTITPFPSRTPTVTAGTSEAGTTPGGTAAPAGTGTAKPPAANNPPASGTAAEKYTYLGQDIPDRSQFLPNRVVTITWTIKNTGTIGWTKEFALRYFAGPEPSKQVYYFTKDVPVNDTINFIVTFTTPASPGDYDLWFKLTNAAGQNFGDLDLVFTVSNSPVRATSTPSN